jgi:hypothetical protein
MAAEREKRPKDWRPGGEHRDPRARYQLTRDEKRRRFKLRAVKERTGPKGDGPKFSPRTPGQKPAPAARRPPSRAPRKRREE